MPNTDVGSMQGKARVQQKGAMQHWGRCKGKAKLNHKGTIQRVSSIGGLIISQQLLGLMEEPECWRTGTKTSLSVRTKP